MNTSSLSYNGLVSGDDFTGSFTGVFSNADIGTGKLITLTPTFSGSDVTNYSITNHPNVYANITIGNPSISGLSNQSKNFRDLSYTLAGISSISGLPITYTSSNTSVATVSSSGAVTILDVGTTTISANISSTLNYHSATASYQLVVKLNSTDVERISHDTIRLSDNLSQNNHTQVGKYKIIFSSLGQFFYS